MDTSKIIKNTLAAAGIIAVVFISYKVFVSKKSTDVENPVVAGAPVTAITREEIGIKESAINLRKLKGIKIDTQFFSDKAFINLKDFRVTVLPEPKGRENPFMPIN